MFPHLAWGCYRVQILMPNMEASLGLFFSTKYMDNFLELASFLSIIFENTYTSFSKLCFSSVILTVNYLTAPNV